MASSWRRVASTHSLEDLLLDTVERHDQKEHPVIEASHRSSGPGRIPLFKNTCVLAALGVVSICMGILGILCCIYMVFHCYQESSWNRMTCDAHIVDVSHRMLIQHGVYGMIIPITQVITAPYFANNRSILQFIFGSNHVNDMVSRMSMVIQNRYPYDFDSHGGYTSDSMLYVAMLIPIICGPVTLMTVALNWFCMKIFKHNI